MKPIEITLDVSKINKDKIVERKYINKDGVEVVVKEYKMTLIPLKEQKFVTGKDNWKLLKTHFLVEKSEKNPNGTYGTSTPVGDGFTFENIEDGSVKESEIPF